MIRFVRPFFRLAMLFLVLAPGLSQALTKYCVYSQATLKQAFIDLGNSADTDFEVRLRSGLYYSPGGSYYLQLTNKSVTVSGGWSGMTGLCTSQTADPLLTVLDGTGTLPVLRLQVNASPTPQVHRQIAVTDLTLRNGYYSSASLGACLSMDANDGYDIVFERLRMEHCYIPTGAGPALAANVAGSSTLTLRDNLVLDTSAKGIGGMSVYAYDTAKVQISHLTLLGTRTTTAGGHGSALGLLAFDSGQITLSNTAAQADVANVGADDVFVYRAVGATVDLVRNHYNGLNGSPTSNVDASGGDAGFVAADDPHLRGDSVLVNAGTIAPAGGSGTFDVEGRTRVVGSAPDVGAFESDALFRDSFD